MKVKDNALPIDQTTLLGEYGPYEWPSDLIQEFIASHGSFKTVSPYPTGSITFGKNNYMNVLAGFRSQTISSWRNFMIYVMIKTIGENFKLFKTIVYEASFLGNQMDKFEEVQSIDTSIFA